MIKMEAGHEYIVRLGKRIDPDGSIPFAFVKELVRCKDCKHRPYEKKIDGRVYIFEPENEDGTDYTCPYVCGDSYYTELPDDNSFCDKGERKDGEHGLSVNR